jgi:hypothetical protein
MLFFGPLKMLEKVENSVVENACCVSTRWQPPVMFVILPLTLVDCESKSILRLIHNR